MSIRLAKNKSTGYLEITSSENSLTTNYLLTLEDCVSLHKELGLMIMNARNEPAPDDSEPDF